MDNGQLMFLPPCNKCSIGHIPQSERKVFCSACIESITKRKWIEVKILLVQGNKHQAQELLFFPKCLQCLRYGVIEVSQMEVCCSNCHNLLMNKKPIMASIILHRTKRGFSGSSQTSTPITNNHHQHQQHQLHQRKMNNIEEQHHHHQEEEEAPTFMIKEEILEPETLMGPGGHTHALSSSNSSPKAPSDGEQRPPQQKDLLNSYCVVCLKYFSTRSNFLRHNKKYHVPSESGANDSYIPPFDPSSSSMQNFEEDNSSNL